jgi:type III secretion protein L
MGLVFLIDRPGYRLAADRKVLKHSEATMVEQITQAYVRAQSEINDTLTNLESVCARATEEAQRTGLAEAAREAAQRWTVAEIDRLALLKAMQPMLADMVVDAVALLAKGIDREAVLARSLELLQRSLCNASWARLRVHPAAVRTMDAALARFSRDTGLGKLAGVVADESLPEDGCVLESEFGTVDVGLDTQVEAIRVAVADAVRATAQPSTV